MESTLINSDPKHRPKKRTKKKIEEISGSVSKPTRKITKTKIKNKGEVKTVVEDGVEAVVVEESKAKIYVPMLEPEKSKSNEALQKIEIEEHTDLKNPDEDPHIDALYPTMNDPFFSDKISRRREYTYMTYDGDIRDIEDFSNYLCKNPIFELMPHQLFVRNFISRNTPYNSILLYHGLGSGKTCSAIGIAEELREYAKQTGSSQRIMVIASTNVQDNFRLQLFDERNLREENGNWSIKSCIGNKLLKEINPTGEKGLKAEDIISQANSIINANYAFMGYLQLANYIIEHVTIPTTASYTAVQKRELEIQNIKKFFNNRLIIIDEVHNIHLNNSKNNENKIAKLLLKVAKYADNMKLVLLSATPVYNSVKEIIWLTNLMNVNDNRAEIDVGDVFAADGSFVKARKGRESGDELLRRKLTGYVSYVRGENPYTFPFRIYPEFFAREKTFLEMEYPSKTLSNKPVREPLKHLNGRLYVNQIGLEQERGYKFIVENMVRLSKRKGDNLYFLDERDNMKEPNFENMESYGYSELQAPLQALIMMYPSPLLRRNADEDADPVSKEMFKEISKQIIGKDGLRSTMDFVEEQTEIELNAASEERQTLTVFKKYNFEYKKGVDRIFHQEHLHKYSSKIASICDCIRKSRGIVLIYTQYIDGGIVPMALALEEMGFTRTGTPQHGQAVQPLFKKLTTRNVGPRTQVEPLNAVDLRPQSQVSKSDFSPAKYMILTGDKYFSYNNAEDVKIATSKENVDGRNVRVILISKAASEGLDFKSIRQVHILDPWYNLNRLEQIIGRGVRNMSHCGLDFKERNVEVYLHATTLTNKTIECADLYVYRYAEKKAVDIGAVNRIMKTVSVDCVLNIAQTNFTCSILNGKDDNCDKSVGRKLSDKQLSAIAANQEIKIRSSTNPDPEGKPFLIGDRPFTEACDYMECDYKCPASIKNGPIIEATYHKDIITANNTIIIQKIKDLYATEGYPLAFNRSVITKLITASKNKFEIDPKIDPKEIDFALTSIIENPTEILIDNLGRTGRLINRGKYYIFQPIEIRDNQSSILDSSLPVQNKASHVNFEIENAVLPEAEVEPVITSSAAESSAYTKILEEFKTNLVFVKNAEPNIIPPKNLDWYIHLNSLGKPQTKTKENPNPPPPTRSKEYIKNTFGITDVEIEKYAVFHMIDTLSHSKKQTLAKYVAENTNHVAEGLDSYISEYFEPLIFKSEGVIKILLAKQNKNIMLTKEEGEEWMEENPEDDSQFRVEVLKRLRRTNFSNFFGFIGDFEKKTIHNMVFKIKRLSQARNNTGAYLQNYIKKTVIEKLNYVLGTVAKTVRTNPSKYAGTTAGKIYEIAAEIKINEKEGTVENPKYTDDNTDITQVAVTGLIEVVMRKLNDEDIDGKTWFLNAEEGIINKVEVL